MFSDLLSFIQTLRELLSQNPTIFLVAMVVTGMITVMILLFILRGIVRSAGQDGKAFHRTVLLIRVPKEKKKENQQSPAEDNINQIREQVATAETLFSAVAGLRKEQGFVSWLRGRNDHIAFELVVKDNKISYYIAVPDKLRSFAEQQVHAQYPHAEITEEPDYNIFKPQSHIVGAYLWFKHRSAWPLKTYKKIDSDPLLSLLNPLSKILDNEGALVQFVVRPASTKWRRQGVRMIRDIREGQKFEYVAERNWLTRGRLSLRSKNFSPIRSCRNLWIKLIL